MAIRRFMRAMLGASLVFCGALAAQAEPAQLVTTKDVFDAIKACYKPPSLEAGQPGMQITVNIAFTRNGELLGHPKVTYESADATDNDRLRYRIAVMQAFQACTPLPFSDSLGGAIAGRPFRLLFDDRRNHKPTEKKA